MSTPPPTATPTATGAESISISGSVRYFAGGSPVPGSLLHVEPSGETTSTDAEGRFSVQVRSGDGPVQLRAEKEGDFETGISSLDAAYILQHAVGARDMGGSQMLACDVTGDGSVTPLDAARILDLAVGQIERFPARGACSGDWLFSTMAGGERRVLDCDHPLSVGARGSDEPLLVEAMLRGDCTGNWGGVVQPREAAEQIRSMPRVRVGRVRIRGDRAVIPLYVRSARPYHSLDLRIDYDQAQLRPRRARVLGRRSGGIEQVHQSPAGAVSLSLASATAINRGRHQIVFVEFDVLGAVASPAAMAAVGRLLIDERSPRISTLSR